MASPHPPHPRDAVTPPPRRACSHPPHRILASAPLPGSSYSCDKRSGNENTPPTRQCMTHQLASPPADRNSQRPPPYGSVSMPASYVPVAVRAASPQLSPELSPALTNEPSTKTPLNPTAAVARDAHAARKREKRKSKWRVMKRVLFALGVVALLGIGSILMFRFIKTDEFNAWIDWIQSHEFVGSLIYVSTFTLFIILCFPSTAFELLAGYIFGFWLGFVLATIGKLAGSVLAFCIGRYLCRRRVKEYMERGHPVFKAFQSLLRKRQVLIVFLTRTAFFPIAMKNYGLSVLDVKFAVYFAAALITGLPFSIIWVYSGNAAQHLTTLLASNSSKNQTEAIFLVVGAGSALLLLFFIGFYTRKHIMALAAEEETANATAVHEKEEAATNKRLSDAAVNQV